MATPLIESSLVEQGVEVVFLWSNRMWIDHQLFVAPWRTTDFDEQVVRVLQPSNASLSKPH